MDNLFTIDRRTYTQEHVSTEVQYKLYNISCIQRPLKGSNASGLLQQVVFKCRFYLVELRRGFVSEQLFLKAGGLLIQVVS